MITEGAHGDRFYVVVDGEADVAEAGQHRRTHGPGEYFGEIAPTDGVAASCFNSRSGVGLVV